jgi:hypothetical protein
MYVRTVLGATMVSKATMFAAAAIIALAGVTAAVVEVTNRDDGAGRPAEVLGAQLGDSSSTNGRRPADPGRPQSAGLATRFPLSGSIADLVPGHQRTLLVQLTNPNPFTVSVNQLTVTASAASTNCGVANLTISPLPAPVLVEGYASGVAGVPVMLTDTAPDACQGAAFPLTFSAEVTRA